MEKDRTEETRLRGELGGLIASMKEQTIELEGIVSALCEVGGLTNDELEQVESFQYYYRQLRRRFRKLTKPMVSEGYVTKGTLVSFQFFKANDPCAAGLPGTQMKLTGQMISGEGTVTNLWSDKPEGQGGRVRLDVELEDGTVIQVPMSGVKTADGYKVTM